MPTFHRDPLDLHRRPDRDQEPDPRPEKPQRDWDPVPSPIRRHDPVPQPMDLPWESDDVPSIEPDVPWPRQ